MDTKQRKKMRWAVLFTCVLLLSPGALWAQGLGKVKSKAQAQPKEARIPSDLAPEQVDSYLAQLTDEQARKLLAGELKEKATEKSKKDKADQVVLRDTGFTAAFYGAQKALSALYDQLAWSIAHAHAPTESEVWGKLLGGGGLVHLLGDLALLFCIVLLGWGLESLLLLKSEKFRSRLLERIPQGVGEKAGIFLSRGMLTALGLGVYVLVTFLGYFVLFGRRQTGEILPATLIMTYYFRAIQWAARLIASPRIPELRLVNLSDPDARFLYKWMLWITASVVPTSTLALALHKSGAPRELVLLVYSSAGPIMSLIISVMIWRVHRRVATAICPTGDMGDIPKNPLLRKCADTWHYWAILFVLAVGGYWWARVLTHGDATILRLVLSLFLVPLCIALDHGLRQMLDRLGRKPQEVIDFTSPDQTEEREPVEFTAEDLRARSEKTPSKEISIYFPLMRKAFRGVLLIFLIFAALELWGIDLDVGWIFAKSVLGVVIAVLLGVIAWEVAKASIDRRIEEEMPFQSDEAEEGGSGGSRSGTLLLLLRKFILVTLLVIVGFSVLASLGVNIGPLLAGAGVIGLAIGFGSQTLVKDIISGIFFLIDDAFRVGDYVEAGTAKGTVEHISLRSIRLRHPRGQIFVVPFGELNMVQNFTRDYIIEKLDIRVRFDSDPDTIRKIIKKINKEIRKEEEFASVLLSDIKSAGVRAMDDSAMIMRVKFKCIPGEQFVLRREVYQRIQKAFKEKGIEFAHRNVTVYLPPQPSSGGTPTTPGGESVPLEAAGAAAAAALAQEEAEALAKAGGKKKGGE
ncbi:MAG: mechanosensitive ion channel family protein [Deltaproteobacteria bacterium]|nr:mechanosensitive ion channel family protein [Deltaproteobacteria bacterium]